ncbi:hypothetical protein EVAR_40462_1 [Eumeta japonica]|uniref:Uncharacterized protein n=1 Tax=Eumeta variegata TaxID=151549 RepID=A0A4C1X040_EUMVA|nr:hypothetical protein EVAR_40462_1 [Eumeta japonica]
MQAGEKKEGSRSVIPAHCIIRRQFGAVEFPVRLQVNIRRRSTAFGRRAARRPRYVTVSRLLRSAASVLRPAATSRDVVPRRPTPTPDRETSEASIFGDASSRRVFTNIENDVGIGVLCKTTARGRSMHEYDSIRKRESHSTESVRNETAAVDSATATWVIIRAVVRIQGETRRDVTPGLSIRPSEGGAGDTVRREGNGCSLCAYDVTEYR